MKRTLLAVAFILGTLATFGQTTQKVEFEDIAAPIYFKFRNDYSEVRMSAAGEEPTVYLDVTDSFIRNGCFFIFIEDTDGTELVFVKCEDNSAALQMADGRTYSGWVTKVTHH